MLESRIESLSGVEIALDSVIGALQVKFHQLDIPVVEHHLQLSGVGMDLLSLTWSQTPASLRQDGVVQVILADEVALFPRDNLAEIGLTSELLLLAIVDMVEDEARRLVLERARCKCGISGRIFVWGGVDDTLRLIAHEFGQVWLEDLLPGRTSTDCNRRVLLFLIDAHFVPLLRRHIDALRFRSKTTTLFVELLVLDSEAVKVEHPLIHLELFDVKLAHQFHNFDRLEGHLVHLILSLVLVLFAGSVQVPLIPAADLGLILLLLRVLKHLHNFS